MNVKQIETDIINGTENNDWRFQAEKGDDVNTNTAEKKVTFAEQGKRVPGLINIKCLRLTETHSDSEKKVNFFLGESDTNSYQSNSESSDSENENTTPCNYIDSDEKLAIEIANQELYPGSQTIHDWKEKWEAWRAKRPPLFQYVDKYRELREARLYQSYYDRESETIANKNKQEKKRRRKIKRTEKKSAPVTSSSRIQQQQYLSNNPFSPLLEIKSITTTSN